MYLNIEVYRGNDDIFIATCPELELYSHGDTQEQAVEKLQRDIVSLLATLDKVKSEQDIKFSYHYYPSGIPQVH